MTDRFKPLLDRSFLKAEFTYEFQDFQNGPLEGELLSRLTGWAGRSIRGETQIEGAFIGRFFEDTWGYRPDGAGTAEFTLRQQFPVAGAGPGGAAGSADLALGHFGAGGTQIPQVLCEFKRVGAGLDRPQQRKGSTRSPAQQALDYLRFARRGLFDSAPVLPRFALVTDMNEFRLYWYDLAPDSYLRFRLTGADIFDRASLLSDSEEDRFDRFLFWRLFQPDMLLSQFGRTRLERLIERQGSQQKKLEKNFYDEYRDYRLTLFNAIKLQPMVGVSDREKLRLAQKLLDRFVFVMFTEDMGGRVAFPPNLLRDQLRKESLDRFYEPEDTNIWRLLRRLFRTMNEGGQIGDDEIHRFNGGLFADDPMLDQLELPNHLFCTRGQGRNTATVEADKRTLLYLSDRYNFAAEGDAKNSIGLYTLGHIFEQSIVELEALEAEAEDRLSLAEVTKRKRDGVYYTPEPIVRRIVEETITPLLTRWKEEAGWPEHGSPSRGAADDYWDRLRGITVVDPACGSGAFLITALRYLTDEFRQVLSVRYDLGYDTQRTDDAAITRMILENNLHGVDINPLSVEIAQLSLWLHTARAREPLSSFDDTIQVGNSLVTPHLYDRRGPEELGPASRERIAAFDWEAAFPRVFSRGGFDVVVGNPPYVKLQNFGRVYSETAHYLRYGVGGEIEYRSTQTGNFDLYLPFIEKGIGLLNEGGRMGYIAPNLWPTLQYGEALRELVIAGQHLERWIDFRSHQVFEEATIYTAIQIFTKAPNEVVRIAIVQDGDLGKVDWTDAAGVIPYSELPRHGEPWLLAPEPVRRLVGRLGQTCRRLDDPAITSAIFQGLITSADYVYHLKRLANGRYLHTPRKIGSLQPAPFEVALEDEIMKPLVSGAEAKRFISPETDTYLLFPYQVTDDAARLWTEQEMRDRFPRAWEYLERFEQELRAREARSFDDDQWYRFGRNQNIDKHEQPKLLVAQLVPSLRVTFDSEGEFYANNVRVNSIVPQVDGWFLLGTLNAPTTDLIFRWLGKPKDNGYLEANRQFIAPLPIPDASDADRTEVARVAQALQRGYTEQSRLRRAVAERLGHVSRRRKPYEWLLPEVRSKAQIEEEAPARMPRGERRGWADARQKEMIEGAIARLDDAIRVDSSFDAVFEDGELQLLIDGAPAIRGIYADADVGAFLLAQWQVVALGFEPKGKGDGKRLADALRTVGETAANSLRSQIIERQEQLLRVTQSLRELERELHEITCRLFELSRGERRLVECR